MSSNVRARRNRTSKLGMPQPQVLNQWRLDAPLWPHIPFAYEIAVQLDARRRRAG